MAPKPVHIAAILILSFVLFSSNIGGLYLYNWDEAKNSSCAREMMERHDLVLPTFNYQLRAEKPPFHYYFMIIGYRIFGVNEFAARFFSVIMGMLTVLTVFIFSAFYLSRKAAFIASIALLSSFHFILQFHMAVPDPYLIFFMTLGLFLFYSFLQHPSWAPALLSFSSFALGALAKGPVAIIIPAISILVYLALTRKLNELYVYRAWLLSGIILFLAIVLPWYIMVHLRTHGEWTRMFFIRNNIDRYLSITEGHGGPALAVPVMVLIGMLPFSLWMIQSCRLAWIKREDHQLLLFSLVISLTTIIFFSLSQTKLPNYTVPAYPFLAILMGWYGEKLVNGEIRRSYIGIGMFLYLTLFTCLPFVLYYLLENYPPLSGLKNLSWTFLIPAIAGVPAFFFANKKKFTEVFMILSGAWVVMSLLFFFYIFPQVDKENPVAKALPELNRDNTFAVYKYYNPAFPFYIKKPLIVLKDSADLAFFARAHPGAYILSTRLRMNELKAAGKFNIVSEGKDLFERNTTVVLRVK